MSDSKIPMMGTVWGRWSQDKLTSDDYGDKSDPDYQAQFVKEITFPGLDLSSLYNPKN
jgi:hypothetical protein